MIFIIISLLLTYFVQSIFFNVIWNNIIFLILNKTNFNIYGFTRYKEPTWKMLDRLINS